MSDADAKRRELSESDPKLPEMAFATRPLYGIEGVAIDVLDASGQPYRQVFSGRVGTKQAEGIAHDLQLMLRIQRSEPEQQMLKSTEDAIVSDEKIEVGDRVLVDPTGDIALQAWIKEPKEAVVETIRYELGRPPRYTVKFPHPRGFEDVRMNVRAEDIAKIGVGIVEIDTRNRDLEEARAAIEGES